VEISDKLLSHHSLTFEEARQLMQQIQGDVYSDGQLRRLLLAFREKGETPDEVAGFASVMREAAAPVSTERPIVVDTAGTGGDGMNTFNISTAAAFVIAGAGVVVAKHGNRAVSSRCGSADVMSALGIELDLPPQAVEQCLDQVGIAFFFAPRFHQATARVARIRRELGVTTIFNFLGPLTNPMKVRRQVIGVCSRDIAQRMVAVCERLGSEHVWIVSSDDGMDEITTSACTHVCEFKQGEFDEFEVVPEEWGFERGQLEDLRGGDAHENALHLKNIIQGTDQSSRRDAVLLNAAAGIFVAGAATFESAIRQAQNSLDEGAAYEKLQRLIETSQRLKHLSVSSSS
jgi:anthranilate phosphoribosyltransferase